MEKDQININLNRLIQLTKGNEVKTIRYLKQFLEVVSPKVKELKNGLILGDREKLRSVVHHISPQLMFFGMDDVKEILIEIETSYDSLPKEKLEELINNLLQMIEIAIHKIGVVLQEKLKEKPS